jgi:hypothetical protein
MADRAAGTAGDAGETENHLISGDFEPLVIPDDVPPPVRGLVVREQAAALRHAAAMVYAHATAYPEGASAAAALLAAAIQIEEEADRVGQKNGGKGDAQ